MREMVLVRWCFCGVLASCVGQWGCSISGDVSGVVVIWAWKVSRLRIFADTEVQRRAFWVMDRSVGVWRGLCYGFKTTRRQFLVFAVFSAS